MKTSQNQNLDREHFQCACISAFLKFSLKSTFGRYNRKAEHIPVRKVSCDLPKCKISQDTSKTQRFCNFDFRNVTQEGFYLCFTCFHGIFLNSMFNYSTNPDDSTVYTGNMRLCFLLWFALAKNGFKTSQKTTFCIQYASSKLCA